MYIYWWRVSVIRHDEPESFSRKHRNVSKKTSSFRSSTQNGFVFSAETLSNLNTETSDCRCTTGGSVSPTVYRGTRKNSFRIVSKINCNSAAPSVIRKEKIP